MPSKTSHIFLSTKKYLAFVLSVCFIVTMAEGAHATDDAVCQEYAQIAGDQYKENQTLDCGFDGLRWNNNAVAAFLFCKAVGESAAEDETSKRENQLNKCRQRNADNGQPQNNGNVIQGVIIGTIVLPAGEKGPADRCRAQLSHKAAGSTRNRAQTASKSGWERKAKSAYGERFAKFDLAREASYKCSRGNGSHLCEALGKPCDGVREIPQNTNRCKAKLTSEGRGANRNDAEEAAVGNWENEAKAAHGTRFATFSLGKEKSVRCSRPIGNNPHKCIASASPCDGVREIK